MSMQSILAASHSVSKMQTMQSVRTQMQGTVNVLRSESKQDGGNEKKEAKADALEEKSSNIMDDLMDEMTDVHETLKPGEEIPSEEEPAEKSTDPDQRTDTLTLSDAADGYREHAPGVQPVQGEAATYKADGSKAPTTPAQAAPTFAVTA